MQKPEIMKMDNFKEKYNYAAAVKVKPTIEIKHEKNESSKKVEDVRVNELTIIVAQLQEQMK